MTTLETMRARTTYVLQTIERALGDFTLDRSALQEPEELEALEDDYFSVERSTLRNRIGESYLGELFGLALTSAKGTTAFGEILHLKKLAETLGVYEIRNSCAHPNRPFHPHYWYRIASLAQDPSFKIIGLVEVSQALAKAESDSFSIASADWTIALKAAVSNNLPEVFEHDRTGLLGRDQLVEQVVKSLTKGRFPTIALVAPGGVGKTALALEALKKLAFSGAAGDLEHLVFVSLKTQKLTSSGLKVFGSLPTIEDVEDKIAWELGELLDDGGQNLAQLIASYGSTRLLICIDNLENLLLAQPLEFEAMLDRFPATWKLLITTRIPVNSAHCLTVSLLQPLMAQNLAMGYSRSGGLRLDRKDAETIAVTCKNNPLAIKLAIDAVGAGRGIEAALSSATGDTLKFSYDLLLDALSQDCIRVLEALFATGSLTRSDVALVLDLTADDATESLAKLSRTSLVYSAFEAGIEKYSLNDAVRELLRTHPKNITLRSEISARINYRRQQADGLQVEAERRGDSEHGDFHVPSGQPIVLREISHLIRKGKNDDVSAALGKLSIVESDCQAIDTYWLLKGLALSHFGDPEAEFALKRAVDIGDTLRARSSYGNWLLINKRYPEAADLYEDILVRGGCKRDVVGDFLAERSVRSTLLAVLFAARYERVIELTTQFLSAGYPSETLCSCRISALRMQFHHDRRIEYLQEAVEVFRTAHKTYGYMSSLSKEGMKLILDCIFNAKEERLTKEASLLICEFVAEHYEGIVVAAPQKLIRDEAWHPSRLLSLAAMLPEDAPLRSAIFALARVDDGEMDALRGSVPVRICEFSFDPSMLYRFAVDRAGTRHYLRREMFKGRAEEWARLLPHTLAYIVPGEEVDADRCPRASVVSINPVLGLGPVS